MPTHPRATSPVEAPFGVVAESLTMVAPAPRLLSVKVKLIHVGHRIHERYLLNNRRTSCAFYKNRFPDASYTVSMP